jgi:hypothetical protein
MAELFRVSSSDDFLKKRGPEAKTETVEVKRINK